MSNIDYDKLRKLAEQHPEIADKVAEIVKEGGASQKVYDSLVDLTTYLRQYIETLSTLELPYDRETPTGPFLEFQVLTDEVQAAAKRLDRATGTLLDADDEEIQRASDRVYKMFYKKVQRLATENGAAPYPNKIDHGYNQPLSGGWDIMKRLQDQLLIEQGRPPREPNPRLANCGGSCNGSCSCGKKLPAAELQQSLVRVLQGGTAREMVRQAVVKYADENDTVVMVNAAVEEIIDQALAVALSPDHMASVLDKHTIEED